tara:strand:+ start:877 stop:1830 length:954 start_codon:yes stop_codon:yes gene_type:complete
MKKVIFITGIAGMVGSNLLKKLSNSKNIIIGIDNYILGKKKFIDPFLSKKNFFFFKCNLDDKIASTKLENIIKKNYLSEVWLLAANSDIKKGIIDYRTDLKNTHLTTINTLEFLKKYIKKNTKIIFTSSSAVYGTHKFKISELTSKKRPESNYGLMKLQSEQYLENFSYINSVNTLIFRFPNVVGPNLTHGLIFDMKKKINSKKKYIQVLGNGEQQKPYSHVSEILNCIFFLKKKNFLKKINFFNIGNNDEGLKVKNIVNKMVKKFNSQKNIKYEKRKIGWQGDIIKYSYSTKKINKLGFKFKMNSTEAVNKVIDEL